MMRVLDKGVPVKVELNVQTKFHDETTPNGFNIVAEIPGVDPVLKDEVVLIGAHFDSVAASTGRDRQRHGLRRHDGGDADPEGASASRPRRTIRIGALGRRGRRAARFRRVRPRASSAIATTMQLKPAHAKLSAYFNSDNGTGKIRGIWLQSNLAVRPIFEQWIAPLQDLGVDALGPRSVSSTDHVSFDAVGLPAFQFMVDRLEYNSRTHHSNMDVFDRVQRDDMVQQATVIAVFAYNAAMRDEKLPRKALPQGQGSEKVQ